MLYSRPQRDLCALSTPHGRLDSLSALLSNPQQFRLRPGVAETFLLCPKNSLRRMLPFPLIKISEEGLLRPECGLGSIRNNP